MATIVQNVALLSKKEKNIRDISLRRTALVKDALRAMTKNNPKETNIPAGIALVTETSGKLLGLVTDGDIRRALAKGARITAPLADIMNKDAFVIVGPMDNAGIFSLVNEEIRNRGVHEHRYDKIIMVDEAKRVTDVLSFYDLWQGSDVRFKRIGVAGLGYVGLTLALTLADLGFKVVGVDVNERTRDSIKQKKTPFYEEGIDVLLQDHVGKKFVVSENFELNNRCDVYFIAVGTPIGEDNVPDMTYLKDAARNIGKVLKRGDIVILRSTVPLGTTRNIIVPILEAASGLRGGEGFFAVFAPERTIEGKALAELRTLPQVIGGINQASSNLAASIFSMMTKSLAVVDSTEEAEAVKLINNTYRDVTFAFANEVSMVCQKWNIDTNKVIEAANMGYARSNVPKPSPGVGGYCLVKDPLIFAYGARVVGYEPKLFEYARRVNETILTNLAEDVIKHLDYLTSKQKSKIFILGFAFKGNPPTSDLRGSTTVALAKYLVERGYANIHGYDPVVSKEEIEQLGVKVVRKVEDGFQNADAVLVMNNHPALEELSVRSLMTKAHIGAALFDTWALYNKEEVLKTKGISYRRL
ncbi:MAG: UDP-N-acetyl-D-mannosaminuronic acid dehydrogenase [Parcubacteria group bacterium Gr01-1014_48]|nr:MAG: UDP-N-acetyl-D-mannosaminuronic acid dehydrogenase [Parcubacteria group bacterium Greene0416_14]TSC74453.1 MAG: UDP-N-acetyl-D-mannosaminuronic acid dehydrogenase [Parcubacteria group bacterium Gr01-1014_48]TSD01763.1 MAG: UDP-N-acetyl-D-mannosaminuronic acid dehydrogenase [Parcubacteria group bacterium Greene1014_15]TSD08477.1 MAG: UDP-N-acetyl-D-mannosaminuronic acid dehydrogenase [Parcubacteria group bacterium Greene0714_4]